MLEVPEAGRCREADYIFGRLLFVLLFKLLEELGKVGSILKPAASVSSAGILLKRGRSASCY